MTRRIAIVGSRDFPDLAAVRAFVWALPVGTVVISGGAPGVDEEAARAARGHGSSLHVVEYAADWMTHGKAAGPIRNSQIVAACDELVAFWTARQDSRGTLDSIRKAVLAGKPVRIFGPRRNS